MLALIAACAPALDTGCHMCTDNGIYWPYDGHRRAEYINEDEDWTLVVEMAGVEQVDDIELVTFAWTRGDTAASVGGVQYSTNDGIRVHAWADASGLHTPFDTPVTLLERHTLPGDSATSTSNGQTFTSTVLPKGDCPVAWGFAWEDCMHFRIDDGDGDDFSGPIFVGEYWLVQRYGIAWMLPTGYSAIWNLVEYDWDPA